MIGDSQLNFEISDASDSLSLFGREGFRGNGQRGRSPGRDRTSEVFPEPQASIEALYETEEFAAIGANIEELRDGLSELRDTVDLPADFPNILRLHVKISELLDGEDSLALDELRVSVEELIASGELTDGTELLASISELDASISTLRASEEFAQVQEEIAALQELQASIETLYETEEFAAIGANIEELRDGLSELRDTVDLPADFPNILRLHVKISELLDGEDSLALDELRVSVEELIASGELTDGTELLASISELDASISTLRATEEFAQVQGAIAALPEDLELTDGFLDGPIGHFPGGDRTREGFRYSIIGELPEGIEFPDALLNGGIGEIIRIRGDRFGGIIGEPPGDGEVLAVPEQLRDRIANGDFDGLRGSLPEGLRGDRFSEGFPDVDFSGLFPDRVFDENSIV